MEKEKYEFSDFYRSVAEGIIVMDQKGALLYLNYTAESIFLLDSGTSTGKLFLKEIEEDPFNDGFEDAITDALFSETHKITRKVNYRNSGNNYVLMMSSVYVSSDELKGIILTFSDISELEKLTKTERRLQMITARNSKLNKQNEILTEAFQNHLDDSIVEQLLNSPKGVGSRAIKKEMALFILMSPEIQSLITKMNAQDYLKMLNHYYDAIIPIIKRNGGTIFELHNDSILASFGAPRDIEDYTDHAFHAAGEVQDVMAAVNAWNEEQHFSKVAVQIGIHTGDFYIGVIGGTGVLKYDVFGKNINFTARMTISASASDIVLSDQSLKELKGNYEVINQYQIVPKGISTPVNVYRMRLL